METETISFEPKLLSVRSNQYVKIAEWPGHKVSSVTRVTGKQIL